MKRALFFVNPNAGQGTGGLNLMDVLREFARKDWRVEICLTKGPGDLTKVLREEGENFDLVLSSGGDGTLNETTAGIMAIPPDRRPPVGYIPRGTVNDVSYNLGLSRVPVQAAKDIVDGVPFTMDVGRLNDRWFNYVAGFGLFTDVAYRTSQEEKKVLGRLAYLLDGIKSLSEIHPISVTMELDGERMEEQVLLGLVTSTLSIGGFRMPGDMDVQLNDGLFEVLLVKRTPTLQGIKDIVAALQKGDFSGDSFIFRKAKTVDFSFPQPIDWTLDGEFGGSLQSAHIENHHSGLTIMIPAKPKTAAASKLTKAKPET